jgi:hypothetical protein
LGIFGDHPIHFKFKISRRPGFLLGGVTKIEFFYSSIHYVPIVETLQAVAMQNWITVV